MTKGRVKEPRDRRAGREVQVGDTKPASELPFRTLAFQGGGRLGRGRGAEGPQAGALGGVRGRSSYPTAPQAHVSSSASSPKALPQRGPGPSACGANGLTGAPLDSAFLQREDREGSGRRAATSAPHSALQGLQGAGAQAGPSEASLGWGCGSAGLRCGPVARQLPSSGGVRDGPAFHPGHRYSGAADRSGAARARSLLGVARPPTPRNRPRRRGRARSPGPCAPPRLLAGGPTHSAITGRGAAPGSSRAEVTAAGT